MSSQEELDILEAYEDYTEAPREVVYLHLNKSTYIIGETLGFKAYVLDKNDKKPSVITSNLYVTLEDATQNIIKQKLIEVQDGVASNTFEIDSLFSKGNYRIKAYTNWMNNFNEHNYFTAPIIIKDQIVAKPVVNAIESSIDAQFLPESGHVLHGVENTIGVVIKDKKGRGIPYAKGEVIDKNGTIITAFKTNLLGIGRFAMVADANQNYRVRLDGYDTVMALNQDLNIQNKGIILSVKRLRNKFFVSAITNASTLETIKDRRYSLVLHNGNTADLMDIYFNDQPIVTKIIELDSDPGIHILTLFNENNQPLAERLIFNYQGLSTIQSDTETKLTKSRDSIAIRLKFKAIDSSMSHHLSASILPKETKSYQSAHSIISYNYLQPYVKGHIQNAKYYFTDIDERKKFELDNLLITQGWSSYDWDMIFKGAPELSYNFEKGIIIKANYSANNLNDKGRPNNIMYHFNDEGFLVAEANVDQKSYVIKRLFPEENYTIKLSEITSKNVLRPAQLYLQFFPRKIPKLRMSTPSVSDLITAPSSSEDLENMNSYSNVMIEPLDGEQQLGEVIVKASSSLKRRERQSKLGNQKFSKIRVVSEADENSYVTLLNYLKFHAWNLRRSTSGPNTTSTGVAGVATAELITDPFLAETVIAGVNYYLNDILVIDFSRIEELFLSNVDYIEINRFGLGDGMRSPAGVIKIYTKYSSPFRTSGKTSKPYAFPLTFSKQKTYYAPKYRYNDDDFYKHYGVIDWKPNLSVDPSGIATIKIAKPKVPITLFIEGIANDGAFVFEERTFDLN
ncbi:MAG: hypothetical protein AAFX55_07060 [Bacteroidota bacterium]